MKDVEPIHFIKSTHIYAASETKQGPRLKLLDLYQPRHIPGPWPLVVWLHSGGFRTGTRRNRKHGLIAEAFARAGYATACLDYRLARPPAVLKRPARQLMGYLKEDSEKWGEEMQENFRRQRAVAVVEDVCSFYEWIAPNLEVFNLSGEHILAGSSAGGISVLNVLMLPEHINRRIPPIRSAFVVSGGFPFPSYWKDGDTRILAVHNPEDPQVPFSSIRRVEEIAKHNFTLIVAPEQAHGATSLSPAENIAAGVERFIAFDRGEALPPVPPPGAARVEDAEEGEDESAGADEDEADS